MTAGRMKWTCRQLFLLSFMVVSFMVFLYIVSPRKVKYNQGIYL